MLKRIIIVLSLFLLFTNLFAESSGNKKAEIYGRLLSRDNKEAITNARLELFSANKLIGEQRSNAEGMFSFPDLKTGLYSLVIKADNYIEARLNVRVEGAYKINLFDIHLSPIVKNSEAVLNDDLLDFDFDDSAYQDSPSVLYSQNDVFTNVASYGFSSIRFRPRGYASESQDVYLAGVKMNDALTSYLPYSLWSGLNEATRSKTSYLASEISDFGSSSYNGLINIDPMASAMRKGWRASILTNSALYRLRLMLSYASGSLANGWSYAFNISSRLGGNDWVQGVFYRSFAYHFSLEKKFNNAHKLSFAFMASPGARGALAPSTQEVYDIYGSNYYNPNWGYQDGVMRNARMKIANEPISILQYTYTPTLNFKLDATLLYRFGTNAYTALDWYDAADPRPDYYRYLPSYFFSTNKDLARNNFEQATWAEDAWKQRVPNIVHLDWDRFFYVNRHSADQRSKYILQARNVDQRDLNFALRTLYRYNSNLQLMAGFNAKLNRSENYASVYDLLGGKYFLNIDQFAERDFTSVDKSFAQNDLDYYNQHGSAQKLKKGDKYSYDYYAHVRNANLWFALKYNKNSWESSAYLNLGYNSMFREGLVRKGIFPKDASELTDKEGLTDPRANTSKGLSKKLDFLTYCFKYNFAYNFLGGHRFAMNLLAMSQAPNFNQAFVSPRTRNAVVDNLKNANIFSTDLNYYYSNNSVALRLTAYYTRINNQTSVRSYYDDLSRSFTNIILTNLNEKHEGFEMGLRMPSGLDNLYIQTVLSYGRYTYTSNPYMTQTVDNSAKVLVNNELLPYWKGFYNSEKKKNEIHHVPASPELAMSCGLSWNYNYWFIDWDVNYFANNYISMNPLFRTEKAVMGPDGTSNLAEAEYMTSQEKFSPGFITNLSIGKSWYIHYKYQIGLALNIRNLLNNTGIRTGGFESSRTIEKTVSQERNYKFDPKYFYMPGTNYMLNLYFRF